MVALARRFRTQRNPLIIPSVVPKFDPTHIAAPTTTLCAIARGGNFIDMLTGKVGVIAGTPNNIVHPVLGSCVKFNGTESIGITGKRTYGSNLAPLTDTMACIGFFTIGNVLQSLMSLGTQGIDSGYSYFSTASTNTLLAIAHGGLATMNGPAAFTGVPFFAAASQSLSAATAATQTWNIIVVNLLTGQTSALTGSQGGYNVGSRNGTFNIGSRGAVATPLTGIIAAAMASDSYMSLAALKLWAQEPWSFWYGGK